MNLLSCTLFSQHKHDRNVRNDSVFVIQIFDQRKWKKDQNQGFLGVVNILMSSVFDIAQDGDGVVFLDFFLIYRNTDSRSQEIQHK